MPLTEFVEQQQHSMLQFLEDPEPKLLILNVDPEMEDMAARVLASFEDDPDGRWIFFVGSHGFDAAEPFYQQLSESVLADLSTVQNLPPEEGIDIGPVAPMLVADSGTDIPIEVRFAELVERISRMLRPYCEATVIVLKPQHIADAPLWRLSLQALVSATADPEVKYVVFDGHGSPALDGVQSFVDRCGVFPSPGSIDDQQECLDFLASPTRRVLLVPPELSPRFAQTALAAGSVRGDPRVIQLEVGPVARVSDFYAAAVQLIARTFATADSNVRRRVLEVCRTFRDQSPDLGPETQFCEFVERLLPAAIPSGSRLVLIIRPTGAAWLAAFAESLRKLVTAASHPRIKYIVAVDGAESLLRRFQPRPCPASSQTFYIPPDAIESAVAAKISGGSLTPIESMRYTAVLGGFAFALKDYDRAVALQGEWLAQANDNDSAPDQANARYNLANTYLAAGDWASAEEQFTRAAEICLNAGLDVLLAMCLNNLGVALYHLDKGEMAVNSFQAARDTFRALRHLPGEAHVLDSLARVYELGGQPHISDQLRREALSLYEGISEPALADVRESGRADLITKLARRE